MTNAKPDLSTTAGKIADLNNRLTEAREPHGGKEQGRVRQRVEALLDPDSFTETDALARHRVEEYGLDRMKPPTDGVVTGYGLIDGRRVCVFAHDNTMFEGALGEVSAEKVLKIYELATKTGVPVIAIHDSSGARLEEGVVTASKTARILRAATDASGVVPQISIVVGQAHSLASLLVPLSDITVMVKGSSMHLTSPAAVTKVTRKVATSESIGGWKVHSRITGTAHLTAGTDLEAIAAVRDLVGFLPENNRAASPIRESADTVAAELDSFMPDHDWSTYDVRDIINRVTDGDFVELQRGYADNVVTGFAHVAGRAVGVVANQPSVLAGCLDHAAATKAARFIRTCDSFNLPIVEFVDSPGFFPSEEEEHLGSVADGATLAYAFAEAQVGKITVITRKAIGPSYVVMGSKELGADMVFAWPTAQIALTDATTAGELLGVDSTEYAANNLTPYVATERGLVDAVIEPSSTRTQVTEALRLLERKVVYRHPRKHGNIPL
ncbi:acyl-CoA carboxylase subunit beta [Corynebacterium aquatimens]|uniref:Propionyl-CoA carboxylase beta chain n=1 Tax=Corynebacterium aquatimens TaxID=1190508 RepID=A0A931E3H2_9CORY|nr:carboxyl transferase domain-containing protein [Corynebacterium aquatimens]MBG6123126.1 propionyl-CoA carboxylase beta chain [Corynebacterium aquatimens]WJY66542.1 putative propionyl-CoA carboxylase beta chain 5 [Corynebacterium aquatimens]